MTRNIIILAVAGLHLSLLVLAQTSQPASPAPSTITATDQDNGKTMDIAKGGTLIVELESNATTGYSWAVSGDPSPLKLVDSTYRRRDQSTNMPGASGIQQFRLEATASGTAPLKLVYRRPWQKDKAPAKTFTVTINVR